MTDEICGYQWELLEPNEEDRQNKTTHLCRQEPGHNWVHQCACGEMCAEH